MKTIRPILPILILFCLSGLVLSACENITPDPALSETPSELVETATLTAISELETPSSTVAPDPLGISWSDLEGQELEFWYVWDLDEPGAGMNAIVDRFNQENEWGITVAAHDQGLVLDPLASMEAAFEEGKTPHILIGDSAVIAEWYQTGLIIDLNPFLTDPVVGLADNDRRDFYPGIYREFVLDGSVRPGMPFSQSIQVIYYNKSWAEELELTSLPSSADDFREQACLITESGESAGVILSPQAANVLSFIYAYGGDPVISIGGDYHFSSRQITEFAENWTGLVRDGCGQLISNYPNPMAIEGEYERFNQRQALMIMGSSLILEHIQPAADQNGPTDNWQMMAFRGPDGNRAVASEVQSVVIFDSHPETELAAWLFLKYLTSPEVQAEWAEYSGFYPTRQDSLTLLRQLRKDNPYWASGVNLLAYSRSVPLHPSWQTVQLALEDAFEEMIANPEIDPDKQLELLDRIADELLDRSRE